MSHSEAPAADPSAAIIDISLVSVARDTRQRREIETADLEDSLARIGQLSPIIITRSYALRAGERRWTAISRLHAVGTPIPGLPRGRIRINWFESLDPIEGELVELEENIKRRDLTWQDTVRAVARIHGMFRERTPGWTQDATAGSLGLAKGTLSLLLRVSLDLADPRVAESKTAREAWNLLNRRDQREHGNQLNELLEAPRLPSPAPAASPAAMPVADGGTLIPTSTVVPAPMPRLSPSIIRPGSFLEWAPTYSGPKFSIIHCDFPYGVNLFDGDQGRGAEPTAGYSDTGETYFALLDCFLTHLDRFMSFSSHLIFWFSAKHRQRTVEAFRTRAPSLDFYPYDLVWHKTDNAGIAGDARRHPRHTYETAMFAVRGRRMLVGIKADSFGAPTARNEHPSCKPAPVLRHFFEMIIDPTSSVFDPTCGSGMAIRVADELGAERAFGLEIDPGVADRAAQSLAREQAARRAAKTL